MIANGPWVVTSAERCRTPMSFVARGTVRHQPRRRRREESVTTEAGITTHCVGRKVVSI
ncbi:hypothetical protein I546_2850 [Mycobacterium kansasii 732]|nr:hypothetical protein I546_2850 [Mycobacterium kansasii 732]